MPSPEVQAKPGERTTRGLDLELNLNQLIKLSILLYLPFHLLEEWAFGFAGWAGRYWGIPNYTTFKWFIHNIYFTAFLVIGYLVYRVNKEKRLVFGVGLILWGLMNAANHLVCSIIFLEYEPGIITGLLWIPLAVLAFKRLKADKKLQGKMLFYSFLVSILFYWTMPMVLFVEIDKLFGL